MKILNNIKEVKMKIQKKILKSKRNQINKNIRYRRNQMMNLKKNLNSDEYVKVEIMN